MENKCVSCGSLFKKWPHSTGLYCSRQCYYDSRKINKVCFKCKKPFVVNLGEVKRIYCSEKCYYDAAAKSVIEIGGVKFKKCNKCGETKFVSEFYSSPSKRTRDNLHSNCRLCEKAMHDKYIATEKGKAFLDKQERKPSTRYYKLCRIAKCKGYVVDLTFKEYEELIKKPCHYCGGDLNDKGYSLDRKNNEPIYSSTTVVPCCRNCNFTFADRYNYEEKMLLSAVIREIVRKRNS